MRVSAAALLLAAGSVAHPSGAPDCVPYAFNVPNPGIEDTSKTVSVACVQSSCTVTASHAFKGVVIASSGGGVAAASPNDGLKALGASCLTHAYRLSASSLSFTVVSPASVVRVVVVFGKANFSPHQYGKASTLANPAASVLVVGGGSGGLGAAKEFASMGYNVTVYDRGPDTPVSFTAPIYETYQNPSSPNTINVKGVVLGAGPGGTQNINGAVYAPGTAADLAASLGGGITVAEAAAAQATAAAMVPHEALPPMMWSCINASNACDRASTASTNQLMSRRSVAYSIPPEIAIVGDCPVASVNATAVTVVTATANCQDLVVGPDSIVVVSAGALVTPELLGQTTYTGWNHYYKLDPNVPVPATQTFEYETDSDGNIYEINTVALTTPNYTTGLKITMHMNPTIRETFHVNVNRSTPPFPPGYEYISDAWHYAGTQPHSTLRIHDNVFVGDTSALMEPFNCHTSMPAVATGVLAARSAAGLLGSAEHKLHKTSAAPVLFVVGSWTLLVGVAAHEIDALPYTKKAHYILMPIGVTLLAGAIVAVHSSEMRLNNNHKHGTVGYVAFSLLLLQWITGSLIRTVPWNKRAFWLHHFSHRFIGLVAMALVAYLYLSAAYIHTAALDSYHDDLLAYQLTAGFFVAGTAIVIAVALVRLWELRSAPPPAAPPAPPPLISVPLLSPAADSPATFTDVAL